MQGTETSGLEAGERAEQQFMPTLVYGDTYNADTTLARQGLACLKQRSPKVFRPKVVIRVYLKINLLEQ